MTDKTPGNAADDGAVSPDHNVANRKQRIGDALKRTWQLDQEIDVLIEEHIKELREEKSEIKKVLRDKLNISAKVFHARYVSYRLEAQARMVEDHPTLDTIKELFGESPIGSQVDMIAAAEQTPDAKHEVHEPVAGTAAEVTDEDVLAEGAAAFAAGSDLAANAYTEDSKHKAELWRNGWLKAEAAAAGAGEAQPEATPST